MFIGGQLLSRPSIECFGIRSCCSGAIERGHIAVNGFFTPEAEVEGRTEEERFRMQKVLAVDLEWR